MRTGRRSVVIGQTSIFSASSPAIFRRRAVLAASNAVISIDQNIVTTIVTIRQTACRRAAIGRRNLEYNSRRGKENAPRKSSKYLTPEDEAKAQKHGFRFGTLRLVSSRGENSREELAEETRRRDSQKRLTEETRRAN